MRGGVYFGHTNTSDMFRVIQPFSWFVSFQVHSRFRTMHRATVYSLRCIAGHQQSSVSSAKRVLLTRKMAPKCYILGIIQEKSSNAVLPVLTATPRRALIDEAIAIQGRYLPPRWPVTLRASVLSEDGDIWEAHAHYRTDDRGTVDLTRDEAEGGSYCGCEPMGLFWSLKPVSGPVDGLRLMTRTMKAPLTAELSLLNGHVSPGMNSADASSYGWGQGDQLTTVTVDRWYMSPGVRRVDIREEGLVATLFLPPGPGPFPAVLDLWGMRGGLIEHRSALVASRGIASLALAYFEHRDLPGPRGCVNVGDSYFQTAFQFLQHHPQVCADRVGILSQCFGFHIALRLATQTPINLRCMIGINGTIEGKKLFAGEEKTKKFFMDRTDWRYDEQGKVILRDLTLPKNVDPKHKSKIANLNCPLLLIVSEDDLAAATAEIGDEIEERLQSAGQSHLLSRVKYPGAGHLIEPPYSPINISSVWSTGFTKIPVVWGGHPAPHAAAQEDSWKKVLEFLDCHLRGHN